MSRSAGRITTILTHVGAAAEIAGRFSFWPWLRLGKAIWRLASGMAPLTLFTHMLILVESDAAGQTYALKKR